MKVNNKRTLKGLLLLGAFLILASCNSGNSTQSTTSPSSSLTLNSYINSLSYTPLASGNSLKIGSKTTLVTGKLGNQQVFTALASVTLASIDMNYYSDDHCESLSSVTTIGGSATTIPAGTYSTNDQSNYNLCNAYTGGCAAQLSAAQSSTFKSIRYKYNYTNQASSTSVCMYNGTQGYEALANYTVPATPAACTSGSSCGYSESYGAQILGIPVVSSNANFSCRATGELNNNLTCWGKGVNGEMGNGQGNASLPSTVIMPAGVESFTQVATGSLLGCAIANTGKIYCWGTGTAGQIGNESTGNVTVPTEAVMPAGVTSFSNVSTNNSFSCASANTGTLYCWGCGLNGQVGNGANATVNIPTTVTMPAGITSFSSVSTNSSFSCVLANTGAVYCWGVGTNGVLGNGANSSVNVPTAVTIPAGVTSFSSVSTNSSFSCALANTGVVYCWGSGTSGQIGNGANNSNVNVPTAVTMPSGVTSFGYISTNANFSCAIAASGDNAGRTYCWGTGTSGQIGNGENSTVNVPTLVQ